MRPCSCDKWLAFSVLEFGKRQEEIMGGKGQLGEEFSFISVGRALHHSEGKMWYIFKEIYECGKEKAKSKTFKRGQFQSFRLVKLQGLTLK